LGFCSTPPPLNRARPLPNVSRRRLVETAEPQTSISKYGDSDRQAICVHARVRYAAIACLVVAASPRAAGAQASQQFWGEATIRWFATDRSTYELKTEPKTNPATLDVTPQVSYTVVAWADVLAEVQLERQADTSPTATPRFGAELHIFSRLLFPEAKTQAEREKPPRRRIVVSTLLRFEDSQGDWTLRDRFNLAYPFNRPKTTSDGAVFLIADSELFIPLDRPPGGDLVNEVRIRTGIGYRKNFAWRFDVLYIWDGIRHADVGPLTPKFHAIDIRVLRQF